MKKVLAVAFAIAILSIGFSANAQVPYVQVFFDIGASQDQMDCPGMVLDDLYIFAVNYNAYIAAMKYWVSLPGTFTYLGATLPTGALSIGSVVDPVNGISLSYPVPGDGYHPVMTMQLSVYWNCTDCTGWADSPIVVHGFGPGGYIETIRWPDLTTMWGIGMTSMVCPVIVPTQETTWGSVKSLYH